jgi:hypothetical protein
MVLAHYPLNQRMALTKLPPTVLAAVISACAAEPVLLNSERIEKRFGSYGVDVLASEAGLRRSSLFSVHDNQRVCRTYAVAQFADQLEDHYGDEHAKVLAGNSIGAVFKSHDWNIHKQTLHIGTLNLLPSKRSISDLMKIGTPRRIAVHVYQLLLVKDAQVFEYATILEAHHPDYLSESDLYELYEYDTKNALPDMAAREFAALALDHAN